MARENWGSRFGFILATTGAAVGLGNIWKFPYVVGANGGGVFILLYLFFVFLIGLPLLIAEFVLGKSRRSNPVSAFEKQALAVNYSRHWKYLGYLGLVTLVLIKSFYSVVGSWSIAYAFKLFQFQMPMSQGELHQVWLSFLDNPMEVYGYTLLFIGMSFTVVLMGVQKGIERASKWLMPALFILIMVMILNNLSLSGFPRAVQFLFGVDFSLISMKTVIHALGHAFFTLAIGAGCMLIYSSYLPANISLGNMAFIITFVNIAVGLLVGLAIFPMVFTYDLVPSAGPGLVFETLPFAFLQMPFGHLIGICFFMLLIFAAWTSAISLVEPVLAAIAERSQFTRQKAGIALMLLVSLMALPHVLAFDSQTKLTIFGKHFFEFVADGVTNFLLPFGGMLIAYFTVYVLPKEVYFQHSGLSERLNRVFYGLTKWVPLMLLLFITGQYWFG